MTMSRLYSELIRIPSFIGRYEYLRLGGVVGKDTFGFDRYLNQELYTSREWRSARDVVIIRDNGCDMGVPGYEIGGRVIIHHMNPLSLNDIKYRNPDIFNPRYLICVSDKTHNAIHFGDSSLLPKDPVQRHPGDTCPWK